MRRTPWVLAGTGAGLLALLGYHTTSLTPTGAAAPVAAGSGPATGGAGAGASSTSSGSGAPAGSGSTTGGAVSGAPSSTSTPPTTATTTRQADGSEIPYRYGDLEVKVVVKGGRITDVETVRDESFDPRSQQINDQAVPLLREQALQAQSANIDGVSGATYTSEAYQESLQAALDSLHIS